MPYDIFLLFFASLHYADNCINYQIICLWKYACFVLNSFCLIFCIFCFTHLFQFKTRMRKTGSRENRDSEAIHYGNVDTFYSIFLLHIVVL